MERELDSVASGRTKPSDSETVVGTIGLTTWLSDPAPRGIALLYLFGVTIFFLVGMVLAGVMRAELASSEGALVSADIYNRLFTLHGIFMIFFVLLPAIPAVFGNLLLPQILGVRNLAFPRLNLFGFFAYVAGGFCCAWAGMGGGVDTGWTFYAPYSGEVSTSAVLLTAGGVLLTSVSMILLGINYLVTIHKMRPASLKWMDLPAFVWAQYITAVMAVLVTPVLVLLMVLIGIERIFGTGVFDPRLGGEPLLFKRLFWLYARPALYMMVLPGLGVVTELISTHAKRKIVAPKSMIGSMLAIAVFGFLGSGNHLFVGSQTLASSVISSLIGFLSAVPFLVILFVWFSTLAGAFSAVRAPLLYAIGCILLLCIGGLSGLILASMASNIHLHGTHFVLAHFHYLLAGCVLMAYLGGLHQWWPQMTGRQYPEVAGKVSAVVFFVGLNLTFLPQFFLGMLGMPRRMFSYPAEFESLNVLATAGLTILVLGYLIPMIYLLWSAGSNPKGSAESLELERGV